jgi:hypothetical protein
MSTPSPNINPKTFTIVDPVATAEGVTGMNVKFGRTTGGPYTLVAAVPTKDLATEDSGTITGALSDLESTLAPGDWFAVATAVNAAGESAPTPEVAFQISPPLPSTPTSFTLA